MDVQNICNSLENNLIFLKNLYEECLKIDKVKKALIPERVGWGKIKYCEREN